jgi:VanZ family protein
VKKASGQELQGGNEIDKLRRVIPWLLVVVWMAFIFHLSHQPATVSYNLSTEVAETIVEVAEKVAPQAVFDLERINHMVRKNAHFLAYLALGILVMNGLRSGEIVGYRAIAIALVICALYAASDEVHQLLVPGRSGQISDAILDSTGAAVGIWVYLGLSSLWKRF